MATFTSSTFLGGAGRFKFQSNSWANVRGGTDASEMFSSYEINAQHFAGTWYIQRVFLPIDTSSIPSDATITGVTLNFNANYEGGLSSTVAHLVQTTQSNTGTRIAGDYNNINFVTGGNVAISDSSSTAKSITGNATSLTWIVKGGTTLIALMASRDQSNTDPNGSFSEWATIGSPELVVTYTVPMTTRKLPTLGVG